MGVYILSYSCSCDGIKINIIDATPLCMAETSDQENKCLKRKKKSNKQKASS